MSNLTTVRVYLEAKSKDEMIIKQMENNLKRKTWFDYSVPFKDGNIYICWYYDDLIKRMR